MGVIEDLSEEEAYLFAILTDPSGLDQAEFLWQDDTSDDGLFRAWAFQWPWWRCADPLQIDQCLAEGTLILTRRGQIPIEEVVVGDEVLTHLGRWRRVTWTWDRGVQPVVTLKGHGHPGITVTADHKFWINGEWKVPVVGDRWVTPRDFPASAVPAIPTRSYAPGRPSNVPDDVEDTTFLWLYGLFVAEGSCSSSFGKGGTVNRVTFSVHEDEVDDVEARLRKVGLRFNSNRVGTERCFNIVLNSRQLATWMSEHGGRGARNKHLAPWVFGLDDLQRKAVLDGLVYGDGYTRGSGRIEYTTTSKRLAVDVKLLAASLGYSVGMTRYGGFISAIAGRQIQGNEGYSVSWFLNSRENRINSVVDAGTARVYDLEVEEDHSFVAESLVVSNCARSVGKSLSIKLRACAFPLLHPGQELLITAPELTHLKPVVDYVEEQILGVRLLREMLPKSRNNGITHKLFKVQFLNGATIEGRIPQQSGRGVKGAHPLWLEVDEASDFPDGGWVEVIETLKRGHQGATWRAHGVTRGVRDYFWKFTQPGSGWRVHRISAMARPTWTDEERQEKIEMYGSRDHPDYRRNILGQHGDSSSPLFVLHRLMRCVDQVQSSEYNEKTYQYFRLNAELLEDRGGDILDTLQFNALHKSQWKTFWAGMDVGYTSHPSEIVVFAEEPRRGKDPLFRLVTRIHLERISHQDQVAAILHVINWYNVKGFALDKTGLGLPLYQDLQAHAPQDARRIKGYGFAEKILVDFDTAVDVDEDHGDLVKDAGMYRSVLEYSSDRLRDLVDTERLCLPFDRDLIGEFQGQTFTVIRDNTNVYGKKSYSKGSFHCLDACKMATLGYVQAAIEEFTKKEKFEPPPTIIFGE